MLFSKLKVVVLSGILLSTHAFAADVTADFSGVADLNSNINNEGNTFTMIIDGVTVTVSGWADTENTLANSDPTIRQADLDKFGSNGWGIDNQDEQCDTSNGNFSRANCGVEHSTDNFSPHSSGWHDTDMFLLQFSEDVLLTEAGFGWLYNSNSSEISSAAISQTLANNLDGNTWSSVIADAGLLWSDSSAVDSQTYTASIDSGQTASQYWLLGAYNAAFTTSNSFQASAYNDGMKLDSIGFDRRPPDPKTEIPEPQTALLMAFGLAGIGAQVRRKKH